MKVGAAIALLVCKLSAATELTKETWDDAVAGKTVFVKFQAPWCGHCKRMKPDWDKLTKEYEGSSTVLIADVDCTTGGKELCNSVGVRGYPTIKTGDPNDLQDYKGGRSFNDLKKHAETLGPTCGPANLDLCDAEKKAKIEEFMALSAEKRDEMIKEREAEAEKLESDFKAFVDGIQKQYKEESEKKDAAVEAIKSSGLGLLKSVHKFEGKSTKGEL